MLTRSKHKFVNTHLDVPDTTITRPSNWNDDHELTTYPRSGIPSITITQDTFMVSGFIVAGDLGMGAVYTRVGASSTGPLAIQDAAGTWFNLVTVNGVRTGWCGAIADSASHPLSSRYATLAAAQAVYPFATALTQEIDYCACKLASNICFGADGSEHGSTTYLNRALYISPGQHWFNNDTWLIRNLASGLIEGAGNAVSIINGNQIVLQFDGIWYTTIRNCRIYTVNPAALCAVDIDGNVPGHPYPTRGVQAITFEDVLFAAAGGTNCVMLTRVGNAPGNPGAQGDAVVFINCKFVGADLLYFQEGYNALNNIFLQCDFQVFTTGAFISGGTAHFLGTTFESTLGFAQVSNDMEFGYDIVAGLGGVNEPILVHGTRSESFRHLRCDNAQICDVKGACSLAAPTTWTPNTVYATGAVVAPTLVTGRIYQAIVGGTSGGVEPTFPTSAWEGLAPTSQGGVCGSTVVDNTVTWQEFIFYAIKVVNGTTENVSASAGLVRPYAPYTARAAIKFADFDYNKWQGTGPGFPYPPIQNVHLDATAALRRVHMPEKGILYNALEDYEIFKTDMTINPIIIDYGAATGVFGDYTHSYISSPYQGVRFREGTGGGGQRAWYKEKLGPPWSYFTKATFDAITALVPFMLNPDDQYLLDTTGGAFTVNLPGPNFLGSPVAKPGMQCRIRDPQGTWGTNNLTINPQGYKINGSTANIIYSRNFLDVIFTYIDDTIGWQPQETLYRTVGVTFANAPPNPLVGQQQVFTDSNTAVWGANIAGGGANVVMGWYNGANWRVMGI